MPVPAEAAKSPKMSRVTSQAEQAEITEQLLVQKMYDRYRASMNGMQVILGKVEKFYIYLINNHYYLFFNNCI